VTLLQINEAPAIQVGSPGPRFDSLLGTDGKRYALADFDAEILVLIFSSNRCPTAKAYAARMNSLQAQYGSRGVQLLAINSNSPHLYPEESYEQMVERAAEDGYTFPYLFDEGQVVAREYGPTRTFEVFVLDSARRLAYRGRFDDSRLEDRVTTRDLQEAIDDLLAGRTVRVPETRAFGCSLDLV